MDELERLYFEKEQADIKAWCREHKQTIKYRGETYYLYQGTIYDNNMDAIIPEATNGFLDLYEYFEYFPQPAIKKEDNNMEKITDKEHEGGGQKMTYAVYLDGEGYVGDVTAPCREKAVEFLSEQGYEPGSYDLRELKE